MGNLRKGDRVMATREIGGVLRPGVRKGTRGVVVTAGWLGPTRVNFEGAGEIEVRDDEIARLH